MQTAVIIGASGGIGGALAGPLEARGTAVTRLSRRVDGLDLTDEASVERVLGRLSAPQDLILVATGVLAADGHPPEKALRQVTAQALTASYAVNAIGPMLVLKHALRLIPRDRPSVFAALSARVGSIGDNRLGGWHSYRASKAALNQLIHGAAIELARSHPQACAVCLHPGTVETPLTRDFAGDHPTVTPEVAAEQLLRVIDGLTPAQSGGFFDWAGRDIPW
ncbi:SDR family NAD(P)-dependent oxidoreductase [Antarcticimicrobium luteum]|uniref:SDR family NAD(P)-dependent oxidoreductase n=1 Tax=Antarcticimicrobium luteum TaxID=2547397 RepID=A0A4R5VF43_9RHOB|nr:SDR family NAD(P)-dependent oxidoreductase [Antarcticimicrobium luteum]TDK51089.1 SDR family NAD(P)-dependent oxidoreductase [Antarcticimicrobium luteum]